MDALLGWVKKFSVTVFIIIIKKVNLSNIFLPCLIYQVTKIRSVYFPPRCCGYEEMFTDILKLRPVIEFLYLFLFLLLFSQSITDIAGLSTYGVEASEKRKIPESVSVV